MYVVADFNGLDGDESSGDVVCFPTLLNAGRVFGRSVLGLSSFAVLDLVFGDLELLNCDVPLLISNSLLFSLSMSRS